MEAPLREKSRSEIITDLRVQRMDILSSFDFNMSAALFKVMGHGWTDGTPTADDLSNNAARLLDAAIESYQNTGRPSRASSGRFIAMVHEWGSCVELELVYAPVAMSKSVSLREYGL